MKKKGYIIAAVLVALTLALSACSSCGGGGGGGGGGDSTAKTPSAVQNLAAKEVTSDSITITYTAPTNDGGEQITKYQVQRSGAGGGSWLDNGLSLEYAFEGLAQNTSYTFKARAVNAKGNGQESSITKTTTQANPAATTPSAVQSLAAKEVTADSITITYTAPTNDGGEQITKYQVQRSGSGGGSWLDNGLSLEYAFSGLSPDTSYTFKARAVNAKGNGQEASITQATTQQSAAGTPSAPRNLTAAASFDKVVLSWVAPADSGDSAVIRYEVQRSGAGGTVFEGVGLSLTYTFEGLTQNTAYTFRVRAVNDTGEGAEASVAKTTAVESNITKIVGAWQPEEGAFSQKVLLEKDRQLGIIADFIFDKLDFVYGDGPEGTSVRDLVVDDIKFPESSGVSCNRITSPYQDFGYWNIAPSKAVIKAKLKNLYENDNYYGLSENDITDIKRYIFDELIGTLKINTDDSKIPEYDRSNPFLEDIYAFTSGGNIRRVFWIDTNLNANCEPPQYVLSFSKGLYDDMFRNYSGVITNLVGLLKEELKKPEFLNIEGAQPLGGDGMLIAPIIQTETFTVNKNVSGFYLTDENGTNIGSTLPQRSWLTLAYQFGNTLALGDVEVWFESAGISAAADYSLKYNGAAVGNGTAFSTGVPPASLSPAALAATIDAAWDGQKFLLTPTGSGLSDTLLMCFSDFSGGSFEVRNVLDVFFRCGDL